MDRLLLAMSVVNFISGSAAQRRDGFQELAPGRLSRVFQGASLDRPITTDVHERDRLLQTIIR